MKKYLFIPFLLLAFCGSAFSGHVIFVGKKAADGVVYDVEENWDDKNESWSELPADWDDESTSDPISGTYSLETGATAGFIYTSTTASGNYYAVIKLDNLDTESGSGDAFRLVFAQSDGTYICSARLYYNSGDYWYRLYVYHSGDAVSGGTITLDPTLTAANPVVVKLVYEKGTGDNGNVEGYVTTWSDYQSNGWANAQGDSDNDGTSDQADVGRLYLHIGTAGQGIIMDDLRGNTSDNVDY